MSEFEFEDVAISGDGCVLTACCQIHADRTWFQGHFPGFEVMPGVAQIQMLSMLIEQQSGWNAAVLAGSSIKFLNPVTPGERLELRVQKQSDDRVLFSVRTEQCEKTRGGLQLGGT